MQDPGTMPNNIVTESDLQALEKSDKEWIRQQNMQANTLDKLLARVKAAEEVLRKIRRCCGGCEKCREFLLQYHQVWGTL